MNYTNYEIILMEFPLLQFKDVISFSLAFPLECHFLVILEHYHKYCLKL